MDKGEQPQALSVTPGGALLDDGASVLSLPVAGAISTISFENGEKGPLRVNQLAYIALSAGKRTLDGSEIRSLSEGHALSQTR